MFRLYFGETTKINFIYFKHIFVIASRVTMNQAKLFLSQRKLALNLVYEIIFLLLLITCIFGVLKLWNGKEWTETTFPIICRDIHFHFLSEHWGHEATFGLHEFSPWNLTSENPIFANLSGIYTAQPYNMTSQFH